MKFTAYDRLKRYEGYHRALPDGSCAAYQKKYRGKLDRVTIGWGCTEGIELGMVWTREEAEAALHREMAKFEAAVTRYVTVPLNQNEFDALCLLTYNIGIEAFARSTVLKRLNKEDRLGAAQAFNLWNKVGKYVEPGLVSRRASESALFLKPVEAPTEPAMPQTVEPSAEPVSKTAVAVGTSVAVGAGTQAINSVPVTVPVIPDVPLSVPPIPETLQETVSNAQSWQFLGDTAWSFKSWAFAQPMLAGALVIGLIVYWAWPKRSSG